MEDNQYKEYTIINPKTKKYHQLVVNDGSDIVQVFNNHLGVEETFESEAYHLSTYAKRNGLILHSEIKQYTPIEKYLNK